MVEMVDFGFVSIYRSRSADPSKLLARAIPGPGRQEPDALGRARPFQGVPLLAGGVRSVKIIRKRNKNKKCTSENKLETF